MRPCLLALARRAAFAALVLLASAASVAQPLPSWNEGPAKARIVAFVQAVTDKSGTDFVPPAERIAVFDNDGTLWCEQPMYVQLAFVLDRVKAARAEASRLEGPTQPFKAAAASAI